MGFFFTHGLLEFSARVEVSNTTLISFKFAQKQSFHMDT